jgi:hypothetical protein
MKGKEKREREKMGGGGNVKVDERKKKNVSSPLARSLSKVSISSQKKTRMMPPRRFR